MQPENHALEGPLFCPWDFAPGLSKESLNQVGKNIPRLR